MGRRAAIIGAGVMAIAAPASANVAITNFMGADFSAGAPACLQKVAGEDVASFPDGFGFDATTTGSVDGVAVTQESVTITGVNGDRVLADEVWRIENNCTVPLEVAIVNGAAAGDWAEKHLEVWLGNTTNAGTYPSLAPAAGSAGWDQTPIVINATGVSTTATGAVTLLSGESVPVGMVVTTGQAAAGSGSATWEVQAVTS